MVMYRSTDPGRSGRRDSSSTARRQAVWRATRLFDLYEGAQIKDRLQVHRLYSITFRAKDKTLEDAEITAAMKKILNGLEQLGIELRQ